MRFRRAVNGFAAAFAIAAILAGHGTASAATAERIVALAPSITETLFALGAGGEVVGVSSYCDYPAAVRSLPRVGTFLRPNIEAIVALRPTLIVGLQSAANEREIRALDGMGYPTLMVSEDSLAEIQDSISRIGQRLARDSQAQTLLAQMQRHFSEVGARLADAPSSSVLMLVGHEPLVAVGRGTFLDELLTMAHAVNVADRARQAWPRLSLEYVIATAPEVIIDGQMGDDPVSPQAFWSRYGTIPAVRNRRLYGYAEDPVLRPGPRVWQSLEILAAIIHPERLPVPATNRES